MREQTRGIVVSPDATSVGEDYIPSIFVTGMCTLAPAFTLENQRSCTSTCSK
jgi:hypothetical protein